jgi:Glu-tRNA(Gln) amidotransferase subunit E-like FAD-binding protein
MEKAARGEALPDAGEIRPATEEEVYARVAAATAALEGMKIHNPARKAHVLMGLVMTALRGRVEGAAVVERVRAAAEGRC